MLAIPRRFSRSARLSWWGLSRHLGAGHIGLFHGTNDPQAALAGATVIGQEVEVQASTLAVHWLDYTLNGNKEAGRYFLGGDAWINRMWFWRATSKNIGS